MANRAPIGIFNTYDRGLVGIYPEGIPKHGIYLVVRELGVLLQQVVVCSDTKKLTRYSVLGGWVIYPKICDSGLQCCHKVWLQLQIY